MKYETTLFSTETKIAKPFLRWAGGKRWLLKSIHNYLPQEEINKYHEPFLGGGAVYFFLQHEKENYISDLNAELTDTYLALKNNVEDVISELRKFHNSKVEYYKIRNANYRSVEKRSARFIYLNQTSFNGIYRVNLKGEYNVPYGNRSNFQFDYDNLIAVSKRLQNANIQNADFTNVVKNVEKGDLVFIDPPYTVAHNNNGFIQYNQKIFSLEDQYRLAQTIEKIKEVGAFYILTNAAHVKIREIFNNGDTIREVTRSSIIGGKNAKRGKYSELIITNTI